MNLEEAISIHKSKLSVTDATFRYGRGAVSLETNGDVAGIEIVYLGWLKAVANQMPNNTFCLRKNNTILFTKRSLTENFPETLFIYYGNFKVRHVKVYNHDGSYMVATIKYDSAADLWSEGEGGNWNDTDSSKWDQTPVRNKGLRQFIDNRIPKRKSSKLIIANQYTSGDKYFLGNGEPYVGYYNRSDNNVVRTNQYAYDKMIKYSSGFKKDSIGSEILYVKRTNRLGLFQTTRKSTVGWIRTTKPLNIQSKDFMEKNKMNIDKSKFSQVGYAEKPDIQGNYSDGPISLPDGDGGGGGFSGGHGG